MTELDFRLLFEGSPDVLLVLLPDAPRYTMVAASDSRLAVTHSTRDTLGKGLFEVFNDNPDDPDATGTAKLRASLERVLKTRQPDTMPVQKYDIRGPDGEFQARYWSPKNLPILSPSGEVLYILHRVEDVTELVRASEVGDELRGRNREMEHEVLRRSHELSAALDELRGANAQLAELDAAKTAFFSNISHEFRTPLTLMLAPLEDELAERLPPSRRQRLETAHRNSLRLLKLVNSLLDFSRIEAGRMQALYVPTDLAALTAELASSFRSAIERGGLTLGVECPPLPETPYVDRDMWEKIVLNLLSNAFKHTFAGRITVRLAWREGAAELSVEDTGIGIAAEELPRLFERFHRVRGAAARTHEGTGIGLSLVRELVHAHGGTISAHSEPGRGSRFVVVIPAGRAHLPADRIGDSGEPPAHGRSAAAYVEEALHWLPTEPGTQAAAADGVLAAAPSAAGAPQPSPRARILWADDNTDMRHYVARLLGASYEVLALPDGQAALEAALAAPPDLVLADVMMPRLDGFGLLRALRADERTRRLPVILLSARAGEEAAVEGLDAGADDYLVKPFAARELIARVRTHVDMARERREWEHTLEHRVQERTAELAAADRRLQGNVERLSLLDRTTRAIGERQDLGSIVEVVVRHVEECLPADHCHIHLGDLDPELRAALARCLAGDLLYEPDISQVGLPFTLRLADLGVRSLVAAPLRLEGTVLGVLIAGRRAPGAFSSGECEFLRQLSEHVALAAHQARLHGDLKRAYEELQRSQQALLQQERVRALGELASGLAHDINNALSPASIYTEMLLEHEPGLTDNARASLLSIQTAIDDVAETVARLREFNRPREAEPPLARVDCNELIAQVVNLTRARWSDLPQRRGVVIQLRSELAEDLPQIMGAETQLRDALTNLIFNAIDAMPEGGTLTVRSRVDAGASGTDGVTRPVRIEVSDTGVGMGEETRRRCLEPFYTTKGERGTGLGLAMVYRMAQRHQADLTIDSAPGHGTTIGLCFAVTESSAAPAEASARLPRLLPRLRVLLIDDDPLLIKSLRATLEQEGHAVAFAEGGQQGIDTFMAAVAIGQPFSVVITDLGMPYVDGRKVAEAIKSASPATPVILLTGWGRRLVAESDIPPHVDRVLGKPPRLAEVRAALAQLAPPAEEGVSFMESA
jgi:signal transduction histidine kinase